VASVSFRHVWKRYAGDVVAVKDLNIEVVDKEFLVLVGPSGCGKSTSLRMLAGLEEISDGEILIGDRVVNNVAPKDRDIAMVFQSYALYPHMSVYDNMAFGLRLRKTPKQVIDQRVRDTAKSLGIEQLLDRKPRQLSGGQRQRVAVGRAIVREPAVFLMDEPLSNLDAKLRVQTRAELADLQARLGVTTVYVTHDQVEAMTMGQRIAVMSNGVLQQVDEPENVYNRPANKFVAGFVGAPPMNFIEGKVEAGHFSGGGLKFGIKSGHAVLGQEGKKVTLGIRPEDIYDASTAGSVPVTGDNTFDAQVDVLEKLGAEDTAYLVAGDFHITATLDPASRIESGVQAKFAVDLDKVHFFHGETEQAIR